MAENFSNFGLFTPVIHEPSRVASQLDKSILKVKLEEEAVFDRITNALEHSASLSLGYPEFRGKFTSFKTRRQKVDFVKRFYSWIPIKADVLRKYEKSPATSKLLREKGNEYFRGGQLKFALESYNLSVMFAPNEGEELGLACANRSAVLLELKKPSEALDDIDLAFRSNYPENLKHKLDQRQTKCEEMLKKLEEDRRQLKPQLKSVVENELNLRKKIHDQMFQIKRPNPLMPSAADSVKVEYNEVKGRHMVATKDIPVGSVLAVEDPYVALLYNEIDWDTEHCHFCLKTIRKGVSCKNCVFAFYCDESCLAKAANEFHSLECNALAYLHVNSSPIHCQQAFRIICKVGPEELFRIYSTKDMNFFDVKQPYGTEPGSKYDSSYLPIYHLKLFTDRDDHDFQYWATRQALMLASILDLQTNFYRLIPQDQLEDFKSFVTELLLLHIQTSRVNTEVVHEIKGLEGTQLADYYNPEADQEALFKKIEDDMVFVRYGGAIYPVFSLLRHSCDGNICTLNDVDSTKLIIITTQNLKKGEEVLTCYTAGFTNLPRESRQAQLLEDFYFKCNCIACRNNWPDLDSMLLAVVIGGDRPYCCSKCSKGFAQEDKDSREFLKCCLRGPLWRCGICGTRYKREELERRFNFNKDVSYEAMELALKNCPREALEKMKKMLDYVQTNFKPPFPLQYMNQTVFMKSFAMIFYSARRE